MKKFKITGFAGAMLTLLAGCMQMPYQANVFYSESAPVSIEKIAPADPVLIQKPEPEFAFAGIVASQEFTDSENILDKISNPENCLHVIILASTSYKQDKDTVFTYDFPGILEDKNILFDDELIGKIISSKVAATLGKVGKDSKWNGELLPVLNRKFNNAKFTLLSIGDTAPKEKIDALSDLFAQNPDKDFLFIALPGFAETEDKSLQRYRNDYVNSLLVNAETNAFGNLPEKNDGAMAVLGNIMDKKNLKKLKTKDWIGNSLSVIYEKGENEKRAQSVYLVSFGDIMLGRDVRSLMNAYGLNYPFSQMDPFYLKSNDILLGNLEGPIAKNAVKTKKTIAFRFLPDIAPILKNNYFDALSMANNHSFDMGLQGFEDTAEILAAQGIVHFGDPRGIGDGSVAEISVNGTNIAFLGLEEVIYKINDDKAVEKIKELYSQGYKVIPVVHWGVEYQHKPNARQKDLAHKFIDAGAIMVIGHHPHVVESFEEYNGHPIFYSLGNAVFDQYFSADTQEGLSIALNIKSNSIETFLFPIKIDRSRMRLMADDEKNEFLKRFVGYGTGYSEEQKSALLGGRIESKF